MKLPSYAPGAASRGVSSLLVSDAPQPANPVPSPVASASARAHIRYFGFLGGDVFSIWALDPETSGIMPGRSRLRRPKLSHSLVRTRQFSERLSLRQSRFRAILRAERDGPLGGRDCGGACGRS